jgi:transcriptional regulator with XRE-family HTH domain
MSNLEKVTQVSYMTPIKKARLEKGFTQSQVAQMVGVSTGTYILWENGGTQNPREINRGKLEMVLGIKLGE